MTKDQSRRDQAETGGANPTSGANSIIVGEAERVPDVVTPALHEIASPLQRLSCASRACYVAQGPRVDSESRRHCCGTPHLQRSLRGVLARSSTPASFNLGQARLIERLPEGNRRAALDVLSEIHPKSASIVNRVRAWKQLSIDLAQTHRYATKSTIGRSDANRAPAKAPEPEYLASKECPYCTTPARASSVEMSKRRSSLLTGSGSADYNNVIDQRYSRSAPTINWSPQCRSLRSIKLGIGEQPSRKEA